MQNGLSIKKVKVLQKKYGPNSLHEESKQAKALIDFLARFKNPLVIILLIAGSLSLYFGDKASFFIIITMVILSVGLDFINTFRSQKAADALKDKVNVKALVIRDGAKHLVPVSELVPGDIVELDAGKVIPADGVIVDSKDLFTNESALTGESFPQVKPIDSMVYMGSGVVSGSGFMRVNKIGMSTKFANIAKALQSSRRETEFEREISDFSILIIKLTLFLVMFIFFANVLLHRNILESILFSVALAVGLTPEMLPLIIAINLSKGSLKMAKQGVIVKQLSAIQNFGSMDVLCTDKTGTLTEDKIALIKYVDGKNEISDKVLQFGFLVSHYSTGLKNPLNQAVVDFTGDKNSDYTKVDEIPFDFERKRESIIVRSQRLKQNYLVTKGAPEEIFKISSKYANPHKTLTNTLFKTIHHTYANLSQNGYRVLSVAVKEVKEAESYSANDEKDLTFLGFLAFLDPPKKSVGETLDHMLKMGINIKIITGDNALVTEKITTDIGLPPAEILTGDEIAKFSMQKLISKVEATTIFARVNPEQKMQIIQALQSNGHVVGYMGDGINDAPSLRTADVGISVNNGTDVAKDAADFILLRKSLRELSEGVIEGRKTFSNTMKYLRMSLSSNFGNMFSMAGASLFLPFLPMRATQILLNNLLYDSSQFAIPLDNVDEIEVIKPHTLSIKEIKQFMWRYGLLSSIFDFITFAVLLLFFHAHDSLFQSGWFLESILTQVLVVFVIRTRLKPFKESKPASALIISAIIICFVALLAVIIPLAMFHFSRLQPLQVLLLMSIVVIYLICAELIKQRFFGMKPNASNSRLKATR